MPLALNEIKSRAIAFSKDWEGVTEERAEAQTFWNEFFNFELYHKYTSLLPGPEKKKAHRRTRTNKDEQGQ